MLNIFEQKFLFPGCDLRKPNYSGLSKPIISLSYRGLKKIKCEASLQKRVRCPKTLLSYFSRKRNISGFFDKSLQDSITLAATNLNLDRARRAE